MDNRKIDVTATLFLLVQYRQQTHDWTLIGSGANGLGIQEWAIWNYDYITLYLDLVSTCLKGVFVKNERGYMLNAIKKRFWSPLILLLSVASTRRKLLKRLIPKNVVSIQIQKDATYDLDRKKIYLISNKSFRYYTL